MDANGWIDRTQHGFSLLKSPSACLRSHLGILGLVFFWTVLVGCVPQDPQGDGLAEAFKSPEVSLTQAPQPVTTPLIAGWASPSSDAWVTETAPPPTLPTRSSTSQPTSVSAREVCSPLEGIPLDALEEIISNPYHASRTGKDDGHPALDFAFYNWRGLEAIAGHRVQSVLAGTVAALGFDRLPYGNMVMIETQWGDLPESARLVAGSQAGQSLFVLYAHLQYPPALDLGQAVQCAQDLGLAGQTGRSGAPHLHLEVRWGPPGFRFSQMVFYDTRAREEEMAQYRLWSMSGEFESLDPLNFLIVPDEP